MTDGIKRCWYMHGTMVCVTVCFIPSGFDQELDIMDMDRGTQDPASDASSSIQPFFMFLTLT